ncbi:MAG: AmmeMemoRadiSam system protein A [Hydrogenothermaceae bacterium]|nr:AmmeMemoRadiSam system protein A [Hydrogenothermaceae bacterium]
MEVISSINKEEGLFLLKLARRTIDHYLRTGEVLHMSEDNIPFENLKKAGASFVTLKTKKGQLRGCIGSIIPHTHLYQDVIHNAISAAVSDPRFSPLSIDELKSVRIKLSILTYPEKIEHQDWRELLSKIEPYKDGLIIKHKNKTTTFLPDVWETLPDKELFMSNLCMKADLPYNCYKIMDIEVFRYRTSTFEE